MPSVAQEMIVGLGAAKMVSAWLLGGLPNPLQQEYVITARSSTAEARDNHVVKTQGAIREAVVWWALAFLMEDFGII